jgi:hypothetical protein
MAAAVLRIDRNDLLSEARHQLTTEFVTALLESPESTVSTPGFNQSRATVAFIVGDNFAGTGGDESLHELLRIVRNAAKGSNVALQAVAWIAKEAKRFADDHDTDRATELAEGQ